MSSMVRLTISSSLGGKEQLSQIKTMSLSTEKQMGYLVLPFMEISMKLCNPTSVEL